MYGKVYWGLTDHRVLLFLDTVGNYIAVDRHS